MELPEQSAESRPLFIGICTTVLLSFGVCILWACGLMLLGPVGVCVGGGGGGLCWVLVWRLFAVDGGLWVGPCLCVLCHVLCSLVFFFGWGGGILAMGVVGLWVAWEGGGGGALTCCALKLFGFGCWGISEKG